MRIKLVLLWLVVLAADTAHAAPAMRQSWASWNRTRPLSASASRLLDEASSKSSIVTTLLEQLEESDLVVYITDSMQGPTPSSGPRSYLAFLASDEAARYVIVRIDFWRLSPKERIVWLAHELQHAVEVAAATGVRGESDLKALYRRIGRESEKDRFETENARSTGNRVRSEIS